MLKVTGRFDSGIDPDPPPTGDYPLGAIAAGPEAMLGYDARLVTGARIPLRTLTAADHGTAISIIDGSYIIDGWTITATDIISTKNNARLKGYNTNGRGIRPGHDNILVEDCKFFHPSTHPANPTQVAVTVNSHSPNSCQDLIIQYCEFDGGGDKDAAPLTRAGAVVGYNEHGTIASPRCIVRYCYFHGYAGDNTQICNCGAILEHNHYKIGGIGNVDAHYDAHQISGFLNLTGGPIIVRYCYIDMTDGPNSYGKTSGMAWFGVSRGSEVYGCIIAGNNTNASGAYGDNPVYCTGVIDDPGGLGAAPVRLDASEVNAGIIFRNNCIEEAVDSLFFSFFYPLEIIGFVIPSCTNNYELHTGVLIDTATLLQPTDHIPAAFTYTDVTGATPGSVVTSNNVVFSGMSNQARTNCLLTLSGVASGQYSLNNGGTWTSFTTAPYPFQFLNGGQLRLRLTTPPGAGASASITVSFQNNAVGDTWTVTNA